MDVLVVAIVVVFFVMSGLLIGVLDRL